MNEHLFEYIATQTSQRNGSRFQRLMRFAKRDAWVDIQRTSEDHVQIEKKKRKKKERNDESTRMFLPIRGPFGSLEDSRIAESISQPIQGPTRRPARQRRAITNQQ